MSSFTRCHALIVLCTSAMFAGCASNNCDYLAYEEVPRKTSPLVMPEGVPAPAERGEFRIPDGDARPLSGRCPAQPPMTLDPEVLEEPEEGEASAERA